MDIVVIGAGHVGLVSAACFAEMGNRVTCLDPDSERMERVLSGDWQTTEPGLQSLVSDNLQSGRLRFTSSWQDTSAADIWFLAPGAPGDTGGAIDDQLLLDLVDVIAPWLEDAALVAIKSAVPVGTCRRFRERLQQRVNVDVVCNPEFIKEGSAVEDFMRPDRIIVGTDQDSSALLMTDVYKSFTRNRERVLIMGLEDAEFTKFAATAMLATRISLMNELALMAERCGADIENIRQGIGSDHRIGYSFIYPGCGYGGGCFTKDVHQLQGMALEAEVDALVLNAVVNRNQQQKNRLFEKLEQALGGVLEGRSVAVWGLAYKPGVRDISESSAITLIDALIQQGVRVKAYDPVCGAEEVARVVGDRWQESGLVSYCSHQYDAVEGADALVLVTEWKPFRQPDFVAIRKLLRSPVVIDGRNQYDPAALTQQGFVYSGIGRLAD